MEAYLKAIRNDFTSALKELDTSVKAIIEFTDLMKRIDDLQNKLENVRYQLYSDYSTTKNDEKYKRELDADESRLSEISSDL